MATYDLEEQEQLDALKAWWRRWGDWITWLTAIALLIVAGVNGWRYYESEQAKEASAWYESLRSVARSSDIAKVREYATTLTSRYGRTVYATLGALIASQVALEGGDSGLARDQLQWVIANSKAAVYIDIARLRMANILLDQKSFDAAMEEVGSPRTEAFKGRFADARGDILLAQNKTDLARAAYKEALESKKDDPALRRFRSIVEVKLSALGGAQ
jgi:predicted negative regulator of RcsB-dependent stress response